MNESDFGRFLSSVQERDIDMLLLEEFHSSEEFVAGFCDLIGVSGARFDGAWHSVVDADGESDLLLRVRSGDDRVGVLIENKVGAMEQPRQAERYHLRGGRARERGKFDRYVTCICAPQCYLSGLGADSAYMHKLSFEEISRLFEPLESARNQWRAKVLAAAIEQARRGYTMAVNPTTTRFHLDYWEYLKSKHSGFDMNRPGDKGSRSNWIIFRGVDFPRGVNFNHKLDQRALELAFENRKVEELSAIDVTWPRGVLPMQTGKTAVLRATVPAVDMSVPLAEQEDVLAAVFAAATSLLPFAHILGER